MEKKTIPAKKKKKANLAQVIMVSNSCGCVFCDLDLAPMRRRDGGPLVHHTQSGFVPCTKPD